MATALDDLLPVPEFAERHERLLPASPAAVYRALQDVTPREMPVAGLLMCIRSLPAILLGRRGLTSTANRPMLQQLLGSGFVVLADEPGAEITVGVIGQMWRPGGTVVRIEDRHQFAGFESAGFARAAMTFELRPEGGRTRLVTETRIVTTSDPARRAFARYWLLIRPFSGLIRRVWLGAVARRIRKSRSPVDPDRSLSCRE